MALRCYCYPLCPINLVVSPVRAGLTVFRRSLCCLTTTSKHFWAKANPSRLRVSTSLPSGKDNLPHIVCTAPNKSTARALHGLLEIAKKAHDLPGINGYVTGDAALIPQVLANGHIALAVMSIINDDSIFKDGVGVEIDREFIEASTPAYDEFIEKLRKA